MVVVVVMYRRGRRVAYRVRGLDLAGLLDNGRDM